MQTTYPRPSQISIVTPMLVLVAAFSVPMLGQEAPAVNVGDAHIIGLPDDWSHHHVIFPDPGTREDAIQNGSYEQWSKVVREPRYIMQQLKKGLPVQGDASQDVNIRNAQRALLASSQLTALVSPAAKTKKPKLAKDWSVNMGNLATVGAGNFPAKFSFSTGPGSASCSDYVVFNTGLAGSSTQPTIIAYNNLYTGCGAVPSVYFSYNTAFNPASNGGNSNLVQTSVVFTGGINVTSPNLAFIQSTATGAASLVLLKFPSTANATLIQMTNSTGRNVTPASFSACTAPCMTVIPFADGNSDANSSPYYDYTNDAIYVGDTATATTDPYLHKFIHIYNGTPSECVTTGAGCSTPTAFPVNSAHGSGGSMTSPTLDLVSGNVFFGMSDGRAEMVNSTTGTITIPATALASGTNDFQDAPLVDSAPATPVVYYFGYGGTDEDVWQLSTTTMATLNTRSLPAGNTAAFYYDGAFDNLHYAISGGAAGHMYVCGGTTTPNLYQITFPFSGTSTVTAAAPTLNSAVGTCSPITEFLGSKANTTLTSGITASQTTGIPIASGTGTVNNDYIQIDNEIMLITAGGGTTSLTVTRGVLGTGPGVIHASGGAVQDIQDWIFLSVTAGGHATGCTGACLYNYNVTTGTAPANSTAGIAATGGTSGIIIDNSSTTTGYSQIYYTPLANQTCATSGTTGGCAVQTSQSAP